MIYAVAIARKMIRGNNETYIYIVLKHERSKEVLLFTPHLMNSMTIKALGQYELSVNKYSKQKLCLWFNRLKDSYFYPFIFCLCLRLISPQLPNVTAASSLYSLCQASFVSLNPVVIMDVFDVFC